MDGFGENLRVEGIVLIRKNTHTGGQIPVDLHKTQSNKAVEPGVGNLLDCLLVAIGMDSLNQRPALFYFVRRQHNAIHAGSIRRNHFLVRDSILQCFLGHPGNQLPPRPDCVFFNCVFVHSDLLKLGYKHSRSPQTAISHMLLRT